MSSLTLSNPIAAYRAADPQGPGQIDLESCFQRGLIANLEISA